MACSASTRITSQRHCRSAQMVLFLRITERRALTERLPPPSGSPLSRDTLPVSCHRACTPPHLAARSGVADHLDCHRLTPAVQSTVQSPPSPVTVGQEASRGPGLKVWTPPVSGSAALWTSPSPGQTTPGPVCSWAQTTPGPVPPWLIHSDDTSKPSVRQAASTTTTLSSRATRP